MSMLSDAYKKSGLRDIINKNKGLVTGGLGGLALGGAGGLLTGGGIGGLLDDSGVQDFINKYKTTGMGTGAGAGVGALVGGPVGALVGGLAGGAGGYYGGDKPRADKLAAQQEYEALLGQQNEARDELKDIIDRIGGGDQEYPGMPIITPNPDNPPMDEPPITLPPGTEPGPAPVLPGPDPNLVEPTPIVRDPITTTGRSDADQDLQKILEEAGYQQQLGLQNAQEQEAARQEYLGQLSDLLTQRSARQFDEMRPDIYEDLNTRGLLRSSELGNALAREQKSLEATAQEQLAMQALQDRQAGLGDLSSVNQQYLAGRQSALARGFSLEDYARQLEASLALGQAVTPVANTYSGKGSAQGLQAGSSVLGALAPYVAM